MPAEAMEGVHPGLERAFARLNEGEVRWCLLRGREKLAAPHGDVDILVHPQDAERIVPLLREAGYVRLPSHGRGTHRFFLGYAGRPLMLDVVTALEYGPRFDIRTGAACEVLDRVVRSNMARAGGLPVPHPEDAFWLLLLHLWLDKGTIRGREAELQQQPGRPGATGAEPSGPLAAFVRSLGWDPQTLVATVAAGNLPAFPARPAPPLLQRLERFLLPLERRGITVALLGPDGAGKSTLAARLRDLCSHPDWPLPVQVVYLGLWQRPAQDGPPGVDLLRRLAFAWRGYLTGLMYRLLGRIVLFDRYPVEAMLSLEPEMPWRARLYFEVLARCCPLPDGVVVLDAPGSWMHRRKGESTADGLEDERARYLALAGRLNVGGRRRACIVDATQDPETVAEQVMELIWDRYSRAGLNQAGANQAGQEQVSLEQAGPDQARL